MNTSTSWHNLPAAPSARGRPFRFLAVACGALAFLLPPLAAQTGSGVVKGEVLDARNGAPLSGAEVRLSDRLVGYTTTDGSFIIRDVPAGAREAVVTYLGYQPARQAVAVDAGGRAVANFKLNLDPEVVTLGAYMVSAELDAETRSRNMEKNAGSLTNIVSSDALGNLPATQVADALSRVAGVSTIRDRGEPSTIVIRGADPSLNSINMDGVPIQSNADNGLTVSLNTFLVDQLSSITVVKSLTPDLPADSIGGYVNLQTKSPLDYKQPVLTASAHEDFNSTRREFNPRGAVTYLTQFGSDRQFGLGLTASYQKRASEAWRVESDSWPQVSTPITAGSTTYTGPLYTAGSSTLRTNRNDRKRYGFSANFDWNVSPTTRLYVKTNYDLQREYEPGERLRETINVGKPAPASAFDLTKPFVVRGNNVVEATFKGKLGVAERSITSIYTNTGATILKAGGRTDADKLHLEYSAGYSRTKTQADQVFAPFSKTGIDYHYVLLRADRPVLTPVDPALNLNDPANFELSQLNFNKNNLDYDLLTAQFDAAYTAELLERPVTFKAGSFVSRSAKDHDLNTYKSATGTPLANGARLFLNDPSIQLRRLPGDFLETYDLGVGPAGQYFHDNIAQDLFNRKLITPATTAVSDLLSGDYRISQWISGGYALANFKAGPFTSIAGARYERTEDYGSGNSISTTVQRIHNQRRYGFLAPSFNTSVQFWQKWQARLAYGETLRRPGYDTASPTATVTIGGKKGNAVSTYNPDLKEQTAQNYDVSLTYYFNSASSVSVGGFLKEVSDTLYTRAAVVQVSAAAPEIQALLNGSLAPTDTFNLTQQTNGGHGRIRGVEFDFTQRLGTLAAILNGFSLSANFTYIDSSVAYPLNGVEVHARFPSQSRTTGNAALDYTRGKWYARVSYNWRDPYLISVSANDRNTDNWGGNAEAVDLKVVYRLKENWSLQMQALNLKNDADTIWAGPDLTRLNTYERSGTDYSIGLNWRK